MITLKLKSDKPCFICGSGDRTAVVKFADGSFAGTLCLNHIYEKLRKEETHAPRENSRSTTVVK